MITRMNRDSISVENPSGKLGARRDLGGYIVLHIGGEFVRLPAGQARDLAQWMLQATDKEY